jgi:hypothetical protein
MFQQQESYNQQNDKVYAVSLYDILREKLSVKRFLKCILKWSGRQAREKEIYPYFWPLVYWPFLDVRPSESFLFIEADVIVNIDQDYYIEHVSSVRSCQKIVCRRLLLFPARLCAILQSQSRLEMVRRQFALSPNPNPLDYFAWEYILGKLRLHKTHYFGLIDQNSGRNITKTRANLMYVVRQEISSCGVILELN